jgi:flagellar assembly protein FliH
MDAPGIAASARKPGAPAPARPAQGPAGRPRRPAILFAEDFDAPPGITVLDDPPEEPEPPPPPPPPAITEADLAVARADAYAEGHRNGLAQAAADRAEVTRQMLGTIAERLAGAGAEAKRIAEEQADAVARLLLGTLAAVLPATCARHGAAEVAALTRAVLPALVREPRVTIRISPHVVRAVEQELARLDPDLHGRVSLVPTDAVAPGDARIAWQDGAAVRDAAALWREVVGALAPLGLLPSVPALPDSALPDSGPVRTVAA